MKALRRTALIVVVAVLAYPAWLGFQVWSQSHDDELHSADAIVVLGAAQYDGEPSPVLKARLDHAAYLYEEGFAHLVIVTGGKQIGDRFTEAEAGRMYLEDQDIPSEHIMEEGEGLTTLDSLRRVADVYEEGGFEALLLVSDPLHSERIKRMTHDLGLTGYSSPASYVELNRSRLTKAKELMREVASLLAYEFLDK